MDHVVGVFVGHHERCVMCRLMMRVGMSDYASCFGESDIWSAGCGLVFFGEGEADEYDAHAEHAAK